MLPTERLGQARTPAGETMTLTRQGTEYLILADGDSLMSSRLHGSEEALARVGCAHLQARRGVRVLVGGLGMGFTLRAALDVLPASATVIVAELVGAVVEWNRGPLGHLANHPLADSRTEVTVADVADTLRSHPCGFDAVLLDVDNGPAAFTTANNHRLYGNGGLALTRSALRPGGVLAVWSARGDRRFEQRLRRAGFGVSVEQVRGRLRQGGPRHTIFVGRLPG